MLIDTEAPVDVLHATAAYRIRSVTQLLESLSEGEGISRDAVLLRDRCDLMDVIGRRLQVK